MDSIKNHTIKIGKIIKPHGVHGQLVVEGYSDHPKGILYYATCLLNKDGQPLDIHSWKPFQHRWIASMDNISNRNQADHVRNTYLYVLKEHLWDGEDESEESFFYADLETCHVWFAPEIIYHQLIQMDQDILKSLPQHQECVYIGKVEKVQNFGGGDILEVRVPTSNTVHQHTLNNNPNVNSISNKNTNTVFVSFEKQYTPYININHQLIITIQDPL